VDSRVAAGTAREALFGRLIDHAALFPPASMGMAAALAEDEAARASEAAWMIGCFVCPASRLDELLAATGDAPPPLSLVLDRAGAAAPVAWPAALEADLAAVEGAPGVELVEQRVPAPELVALAAERVRERLPAARAYLEPPLGGDWRGAIAAAAAAGAAVKLRCGGAVREAFPSVGDVAAFLAACRDARVALKATAGLHHPIRHLDRATGFPMHGFLNLLAAAVLAHRDGLGAGELATLVAEQNPAAFALADDALAIGGRRASAADIARARGELFHGYGSCSWREPVDDLRALGLLPK
jgi:hypothetical protein